MDSMLLEDLKWQVMFSRLQVFKEKHGHCKVPENYPDDMELGKWVAEQKAEYKKPNHGKLQRPVSEFPSA